MALQPVPAQIEPQTETEPTTLAEDAIAIRISLNEAVSRIIAAGEDDIAAGADDCNGGTSDAGSATSPAVPEDDAADGCSDDDKLMLERDQVGADHVLACSVKRGLIFREVFVNCCVDDRLDEEGKEAQDASKEKNGHDQEVCFSETLLPRLAQETVPVVEDQVHEDDDD